MQDQANGQVTGVVTMHPNGTTCISRFHKLYRSACSESPCLALILVALTATQTKSYVIAGCSFRPSSHSTGTIMYYQQTLRSHTYGLQSSLRQRQQFTFVTGMSLNAPPKKKSTNLINQKPLAIHIHPLPPLTYNRQHRYASSIMGIP